ncbi:MAG: lysozyme [Nitrosomonas sp.]|nr:lysozyme [Nitrosomonas sp.]
MSHQTADKLSDRSNQLVQKTADAIYDRLDRLIPGIFLEEPSKGGLPQGMTLRKISDEGIQLVKESEGFIPTLYDDPAGFCTIGYGHLVKYASCDGDKPSELAHCEVSTPGELRNAISELRGEQILRCDVIHAEAAVTRLARPDLTEGEFAALVDFVFNVGARRFEKSTLLRVVNNGNYQRVPVEFRRWVLADGKFYGSSGKCVLVSQKCMLK